MKIDEGLNLYADCREGLNFSLTDGTIVFEDQNNVSIEINCSDHAESPNNQIIIREMPISAAIEWLEDLNEATRYSLERLKDREKEKAYLHRHVTSGGSNENV